MPSFLKFLGLTAPLLTPALLTAARLEFATGEKHPMKLIHHGAHEGVTGYSVD